MRVKPVSVLHNTQVVLFSSSDVLLLPILQSAFRKKKENVLFLGTLPTVIV